jgi:hypothetical protein
MKQKTKVLAVKSQQHGMMLSSYIALYLLLEHLNAHSIFYWALGGLFTLTTFVFIFREQLYDVVTVEDILENK